MNAIFANNQTAQTLRTMFKTPGRNTKLDPFREKTFAVILDATLVVGLLAAVVNGITNLIQGELRFVLAVTLSYLLVAVIRFPGRHWSYNTRASAYVAVLVSLGIFLSLTKATVGDGRIWLLVAALMASLLLSIRTGLILLGGEILIWFLLWELYRAYPNLYPGDHLQALIQPDNFSLWLNTGFIFASVGVAMISSLAVLLHYLTLAMEQSHQLTADIRTEMEHRKRVMQTLATSEEKYRRLLEHSPTLIMELDRDLRILTVNQAMKESLGVPDAHLMGTHAAALVDEKTAARRRQIIHEALENDRIIRVQEERQGRIFQSTYVPSPTGNRLQVISYDITLLKKTEQELIRYQEHLEELVEEKTLQLEQEAAERIRAEKAALSAQKLADLGMLTTGVAHELNSPLQSILTWSEVLLLALRKNALDQETVSLVKEHLNNIKESVLRCSKIVSSLRYYAHTHHLEYKTCQLDEILEDTLVLIDHQLNDLSIRVETEIQGDLPEFYCMRYQISQLLVNLLINARDAVGEHGEIKVTLAHHPDPGMFEIRVEDSGEGIHPEIEEEIFKPFFTTKEVGQGTGLGLFIVSGIVEAHGGEIQVESELGTGTEFIITFPEQLPEDLPVNPVIKGRYSDMVD